MTLLFGLLNSLGLAGVAIFIYYVQAGLKTSISTLQKTIEEQKKTLEAVRERADEFNRLSQGYKQALEDFDQMGIKLNERRQAVVKELEEANRKKDEKLVEFRNLELMEIELKQKSLDALPELESRLKLVIDELDSKIKILSPAPRQAGALSSVSVQKYLAFRASQLLRNHQLRTLLSPPDNCHEPSLNEVILAKSTLEEPDSSPSA